MDRHIYQSLIGKNCKGHGRLHDGSHLRDLDRRT